MKKVNISILSVLAGGVLGAGLIGIKAIKKVYNEKANTNKFRSLFHLMSQWVKVNQDGKRVIDFFEEKGYKKIAIYGMGYVGEILNDEFRDSNITVEYGIDKNADSIYADVDVISVNDPLMEVDAVVVTAITYFEEIEKELSEKISCPIISLEDILNQI